MFLGGIGRQKYLLCGLFAVMILSSFFVFTANVSAKSQGEMQTVGGVNAEANKVTTGVFGDVGEAVATAVVTILSYFVNFLIKTIGLLSHIIIGVASYNNFVNETAIVNAWMIVRDIANMFFVVVFLVIAIGTILGIGQYSYKKALPRLLLMAVLINFSRTIAGVVIDFGQVIMLTFVNAFHDTAASNFIMGLRLNDVWTVNMSAGEGATKFAELVFSYFLATLVTIVAFVVMLVMTVVLVFRIVMLWMLLAISPLAFFAWAVPGKTFGGYFDKWWKQFINNVISGPILAFFLWLALTVMASSDTSISSVVTSSEGSFTSDVYGLSTVGMTSSTIGITKTSLNVGSTELGKEVNLLKYLISIGMLVGGLQMTKELQVIGSGFAGDALKYMEKTGKSLSKRGAMFIPRQADERYGIRQKMWRVASTIPGLKRIGLGKAAAAKAESYQQAQKRVGDLKNAGTKDLASIIRSREFSLKTPMERAEIMKMAMGRYDYEQNFTQQEQGRHLEQFEEIAKKTGVADLGIAAHDMKLANPHRLGSKAEMAKALDGEAAGDIASKLSLKARKSSMVLDYMGDRVGEMNPLEVGQLMGKFSKDVAMDAHGNATPEMERFAQNVVAGKNEDEFNYQLKQVPAAFRPILEQAYGRQPQMLANDPRSIKDAGKLQTFVQGLGGKVADMSPEALKDKRVVGAMTNNQVDELVKAGKLEVGALDVGRLTANNGALAGRIAEQGGPEMVNRAAQTFGANFSAALGSYLSHPPGGTPLTAEQETKVRSAQFIASSDEQKSFDYNRTTRQFNTTGGQDSFLSAVGDPKQVMDIVSRLDVNVMAENGYQNHMAEGVAMGVSVSALKKMMASGMDADLMRTIKEAIISTAKADPNDKSLQDKARYVNNAVGFSEL